MFYLADRKGWSLAADQQSPKRLASYERNGARFLVEPDPGLAPAGSMLGRAGSPRPPRSCSSAAERMRCGRFPHRRPERGGVRTT